MNVDFYNRVMSGEPMTHVLAGRALWQLSGPDRERYLNGQVTQDVAALAEGEAGLAAVCTAKGRMEGALWIARQGDAYFLDADPALRESLGARLEKYLIADDATFEDISDSWSLSHVFGAAAPVAPRDRVRHPPRPATASPATMSGFPAAAPWWPATAWRMMSSRRCGWSTASRAGARS